MSSPRPVLLVEDNPDDAELIRRALKGAHPDSVVLWVQDGSRALEYLRENGGCEQHLPAFILLDVKLLGMSGPQVLAALRAEPNPALRTVPVIMFSSSDAEEDRIASYERGANAYVVKPVDFGRLREAVRTVGDFWAHLNQPPPRVPAAALAH